MNAMLMDRFTCQMGDFSSSSSAYARLRREVNDLIDRAQAAGRLAEYTLNFREANEALSSMSAILNYWEKPSAATCLVRQGLNYVEAFRSSTRFCATFLSDSAYESEVNSQRSRVERAIAGPRAVFGAQSGSLFQTIVQPIKDIFFEEETPAPVTTKPPPSPGTVSLTTLLTTGVKPMFSALPTTEPSFDLGCRQFDFYGSKAGQIDYTRTDPFYIQCADVYLGGNGDGAVFRTGVANTTIRRDPGGITTPQPGTQGTLLQTTGQIRDILNAVTQGWTQIEQARLMAAMLKAQRERRPVYVPPPPPERKPWGWIIGGGAALLIGGVILFALLSRKKGGAAAVPAAVVPKLEAPKA